MDTVFDDSLIATFFVSSVSLRQLPSLNVDIFDMGNLVFGNRVV